MSALLITICSPSNGLEFLATTNDKVYLEHGTIFSIQTDTDDCKIVNFVIGRMALARGICVSLANEMETASELDLQMFSFAHSWFAISEIVRLHNDGWANVP